MIHKASHCLTLPLVLLAAAFPVSAQSATFTIADGDVAGLITAIHTANGTPDADTIDLPTHGTYDLLDVENSSFYGDNGLPVITSPVTINGNGTTIRRNSSAGIPDFRIFLVANGPSALTLNDLTIAGGRTTAYGGGGLLNTGVAHLVGCTVTDNSGDTGGGILNYCGTLTVLNSTVSHNTGFSAYGGGGILNLSSSCASTVSIVNSTIFENRADGAAGFQGRGDALADAFSAPGSIVVKNSILASPVEGLGDDVFCAAGVVSSLGHNIVGDASGALSGVADLNSTDPLLGPLTDNGGPSRTHAPLPGSPAIDSVPLGNCTDIGGAAIDTDQRGVPRPQGLDCDAGSVEANELSACASFLPKYPPAFWPFVVQVRPALMSGSGFIATGVVVDARWVLVAGLDVAGLAPSDLVVSIGGGGIPVTSIEFPGASDPFPFDATYPGTGNLALLGLASPIAAPVAALPSGLSNHYGESITLPWYTSSAPLLSVENGTIVTNVLTAVEWGVLGVAITAEHIGVTNLSCADVEGPMFALESGAPVILGMASFFHTEAGFPSSLYPTVFTSVVQHLPWIEGTIASAPPAPASPWTDLGYSLDGVTGPPLLVGTGPLTAGSAGDLTLSNANPAPLSLLFVSLGSKLTPFKCGTIVPSFPGFGGNPYLIDTSTGGATLSWSSWPAGASGYCLYYQYAIPDPAAACGFALSNALRAAMP